MSLCLSAALLFAVNTAAQTGKLDSQTTSGQQELSRVSQVRALTAEQAAKARPVRLRGVVTVLSGWKSSFFLQDANLGISVDRTSDSPELHSGDEVEVQGVSGPGLFAPIVVANHVTVLGKGDTAGRTCAHIRRAGRRQRR